MLFVFIVSYFMILVFYQLFMHFDIEGHYKCFQFGAIMDKAAMDILICVSWYRSKSMVVGHRAGICPNSVGSTKQSPSCCANACHCEYFN